MVSQKYQNAPEVLSIFVESDKVNGTRSPDAQAEDEAEEEGDFSGYCASAKAIADRLDLMGFTEASARQDFVLTLKDDIADRGELWSDHDDPGDEMYALFVKHKAAIAFLSTLSFDSWVDAVGRVRSERVCWRDYDADARRQVYTRALKWA